MSTVQDKIKCPKCGYQDAIYELDIRSHSEWIACEHCNYYWSAKKKSCAEKEMKELKEGIENFISSIEIVERMQKLIDILKVNNISSVGDVHLEIIVEAIKLGGFDKLNQDKAKQLHVLLHRCSSYYALDKNGNFIWVETEGKMNEHIVMIPLRPISELPAAIDKKIDEAKKKLN